MTECNAQPLLFSSLGHKKIVADFSGGDLTSDGGLPLLREVDRKIGLIDALDAAICDPRFQPLVVHEQRTLLAQRIFALAAGYEDINDHQTLRTDTLLASLTDRNLKAGQKPGDPLSSPPTLCRLENRLTRSDLVRMSKVLVEVFIASHDTPPKELVLDFDATNDPVHGNQEGRFFHGYYDCYCYLPLYVFCGDHLLWAQLRKADIDASAGSVQVLERLVKIIRHKWPLVKILLRGDSGFCRDELMRWCEAHGVKYLLGLAKNKRLLKRITRPMKKAKRDWAISGRASRRFIQFSYRTRSSWARSRRVVAKAEYMDKGENPRFVVTNLGSDEYEGLELYEKIYCARGEMENRTKEQQLHLFADRTSSATMRANQIRLWFSSLAYVIMNELRSVGLRGTRMAEATCQTVRLKLLKIGARVCVSVRRVSVSMAGGYPDQILFGTILENLQRAYHLQC